MPDFALTGGKGKTKHRSSSNKKRTVKAASTYGEAYRKYVKMYGGQTKDGEKDSTEEEPKNGVETENGEPKKGILASVASALGFGDKKKEEVNNKPEGDDDASSGSESEEDPEKEKERKEREEKEKEQGEEGNKGEKGKEESSSSPFSAITEALSGAEERISKEKANLEETIEKGRETLATATTNTVSELANGVKNTTESVSSNLINRMSNLTTGSTTSPPMNESSAMPDQNEYARNEAISTLAGEAVGTSMSAAERALESMKDALKAFQLALAAVETVIGATKASVVASSVNERMQTTPAPMPGSSTLVPDSLSPSSSSSSMSPSGMDDSNSNDASLKEMNETDSGSSLPSSDASSSETKQEP